MAFSATTEIKDSIGLITLAGRLDGASAPLFLVEVEKVAAAKSKTLVLCLKDLEYMASAGLRVLIMAKQKMGTGVRIFAIAPQEVVKETIEISGFAQGLTLLADYDAALIEKA